MVLLPASILTSVSFESGSLWIKTKSIFIRLTCGHFKMLKVGHTVFSVHLWTVLVQEQGQTTACSQADRHTPLDMGIVHIKPCEINNPNEHAHERASMCTITQTSAGYGLTSVCSCCTRDSSYFGTVCVFWAHIWTKSQHTEAMCMTAETADNVGGGTCDTFISIWLCYC